MAQGSAKKDSPGKGTSLRDARTSYGEEVQVFYGPDDLKAFDYHRDLGNPGEYPYTRGIYPDMYRGKLWTIRQYAGQASSEETNSRFKFLLQSGQTGLSIAFDLPTQLGLDSDDPLAEDDVGKLGVAVDTLADMERIFEGIPLDRVSTSFTINSTASIILAMYIIVGEKQGVPPEKLRGTLQNDILKEYIARGTWVFSPGPSLRLIGDTIEYCCRNIPRFNPISVSGTHICEYGATAAQTIALTILNAIVYIREALRRGFDIDEIAPLIVFHQPVGGIGYHFFEDIAKLRAGRRLWARIMKEQFNARKPESMRFKFSTGGMGSGMTTAQPLNNIARETLYALAAVLAGTRSLNMACFDEAYAIPSDLAIRTAVRVQQIIAHESGVTDTVDPLAGSYYIEHMTTELEKQILDFMEVLEAMGGVVKAIESGYLQRTLARQSYELQRKIATEEFPLVGVNCFITEEEEKDLQVYRMDPATRDRQVQRLREVKNRRDQTAVNRALENLEEAAGSTEYLMPFIFEAVRSYATVGEIIRAMQKKFGVFKEPISI
ncbi:MAG: methylmalonyl-CoA mutase [Deltaproteobacteria bacterium]|nr:methylmalonyl-CoA mutase [Deltaproteobacteria bacterium]